MLRTIICALALIGVAAASTPDLPEAPKPVKRSGLRFPYEAQSRDMAGKAVLTLDITSEGEPTNIAVFDEKPAGFGFADAAIDAVEDWKFAPGRPGRYRLSVKFYLELYAHVPAPDVPLPPAPQPVTYVPPVYPPVAYGYREEGSATVAIRLEVDGRVGAISVLRTGEALLFGDAAAAAVFAWRFPEDQPGVYAVKVDFNFAALEAGRLRKHPLDE